MLSTPLSVIGGHVDDLQRILIRRGRRRRRSKRNCDVRFTLLLESNAKFVETFQKFRGILDGLRIKAGEWTGGCWWGGPIVGQKKKGIVIHLSELC